jgi:hypothetical protein
MALLSLNSLSLIFLASVCIFRFKLTPYSGETDPLFR